MKNAYQSPEIHLILVNIEDLIRTSGGGGSGLEDSGWSIVV